VVPAQLPTGQARPPCPLALGEARFFTHTQAGPMAEPAQLCQESQGTSPARSRGSAAWAEAQRWEAA